MTPFILRENNTIRKYLKIRIIDMIDEAFVPLGVLNLMHLNKLNCVHERSLNARFILISHLEACEWSLDCARAR